MPRPMSGEELQELRDTSRRHARALSGVGIAITGCVLAALTMIMVVVLDYNLHQPIHRVIKVLGAGALGLAIVLLPHVGLLAFPVVLPYLGWIPPIPLPGMNALNLLIGTVFTSWAVGRVLRAQPLFRSSRVGPPLGLLFALIVLGVVRGAAFPTGLEYNLYGAIVATVRVAAAFLVFYVTLCMVRGEKQRRQLVVAVLVGLALESVTTIMLGRTGKGGRAAGSIGQSNELGTFLAMYACLAAAMIPMVRNMLGKIMLGGVTVAAAFGVILSLSRAGMIAIGVGLFYVGLRSSRLLTALLVLAAITSPFWAPDYLKDRITGTAVESDDSDAAELDNASAIRVATWQALLRVVQDHPLDGVGFNGLPDVLPQSGAALGVDVMDSSHNTFLRMLGELGIAGLAAFAWVLWTCFALSQAVLRAARTPFDRQLGVGLGAATIALVVSCAFGDRFLNPMITGGFWITAALAEDVLHEARAMAPQRSAVTPAPSPPAGAPA